MILWTFCGAYSTRFTLTKQEMMTERMRNLSRAPPLLAAEPAIGRNDIGHGAVLRRDKSAFGFVVASSSSRGGRGGPQARAVALCVSLSGLLRRYNL
ncbi:hypothetical protein EVAR_25344_1 [Eumeta japonica]|uniref:Uncharacterized protein n=1 Tax=Eumeta variegata TaxID=151549 RepID=A0A4C1XWH3_EUMVA|nr:hypothetical protein EVAR_25344_1 [Eumeta japonica]